MVLMSQLASNYGKPLATVAGEQKKVNVKPFWSTWTSRNLHHNIIHVPEACAHFGQRGIDAIKYVHAYCVFCN